MLAQSADHSPAGVVSIPIMGDTRESEQKTEQQETFQPQGDIEQTETTRSSSESVGDRTIRNCRVDLWNGTWLTSIRMDFKSTAGEERNSRWVLHPSACLFPYLSLTRKCRCYRHALRLSTFASSNGRGKTANQYQRILSRSDTIVCLFVSDCVHKV